ncbi:12937_t:CDS:10 [Ambispora leptoticha]|uniref:12937_t:CDS:1 n=1 Tax=Ambispora leptoticha TaxID=144679 RepID=A0A9N8YY72_9GLOM|nr:12937_t:CDS:10 [Ambispora leptoticha]
MSEPLKSRRLVDLHPNLALGSLIQELLVYCSNKKYGCPASVRLDSLEHHSMYCTYSPALCKNSKYGCDFKGTTKTVQEHLEQCVYEKFKEYIESNNERIAKLEKKIEEQQNELGKLQKIVHMSRIKHTPTNDLVNGNGDFDSSHEEEEESKFVTNTFPHGDITCCRTISQHTCGVTSLAYNDGLIFAGAHDGSTKIFREQTGELIKNLHGHQMSVWALAVHAESERFFSAGSDGTIKAWDWKSDTPNCIRTLTQHSGKIYGLVINNNRLYSASSDKTVKVWDPVTLENLATFTGHTDGVNNLIAMKNGKLATAGSDNSVKIWDVTSGRCLHTISSHSSEVLDVTAGDNMLFASTYDAVIHAYNLNDYTPADTLSGHNWEVWQLEYTNGSLFSASFDHTIKRWNVRNQIVCDLTLKGHQGFVHAMTLGDCNLITGCADRTIKVKCLFFGQK